MARQRYIEVCHHERTNQWHIEQYIEVHHDLANQWHIRVNPDGTKTLLARPDLGHDRTMEMLEDLLHDRFDGCRVCVRTALAALGVVPTGSTRAAIIARLIQEMAAESAEEAHPDIVSPRDPQHRCIILGLC